MTAVLKFIRCKPILVILPFLFLGLPALHADSVTLSPVADTAMLETAPDNNLGRRLLGAGANRVAQSFRTLLRFDVTGIPSNATVTAVSLDISIVQVPFPPAASEFLLHRFLVPWVEGTGVGFNEQGAPALPGETTWNSQFHGSARWSTPGTAPTVHYASAASTSVAIGQDFGVHTFQSTSALVADVQAWVNGNAANHGWIIIGSLEDTPSTARRFASREDATQAPRLIVEYTMEMDPTPNITSAAATNGGFELRFTVPSTYCYEVQYRDSLSGTASSWSALTNFCAPVGDVQAVASDTISNPQRFYRLRISGRVR
jgi:hypothetical protein